MQKVRKALLHFAGVIEFKTGHQQWLKGCPDQLLTCNMWLTPVRDTLPRLVYQAISVVNVDTFHTTRGAVEKVREAV